MSGDRFEFRFFRGSKRNSLFPGILGDWNQPQFALGVSGDPLLVGFVYVNGNNPFIEHQHFTLLFIAF